MLLRADLMDSWAEDTRNSLTGMRPLVMNGSTGDGLSLVGSMLGERTSRRHIRFEHVVKVPAWSDLRQQCDDVSTFSRALSGRPGGGGMDAIGAELEWMKNQQMSLEQKRGLLELRRWIQIMTCHEDNEISFEIPSISKGSIQVSGFKLAQAPADESVFEVKENAVADAFLGRKIIYNGLLLVGL